jgi:hypothetical protein
MYPTAARVNLLRGPVGRSRAAGRMIITDRMCWGCTPTMPGLSAFTGIQVVEYADMAEAELVSRSPYVRGDVCGGGRGVGRALDGLHRCPPAG